MDMKVDGINVLNVWPDVKYHTSKYDILKFINVHIKIKIY
jgi:hypothetical protein